MLRRLVWVSLCGVLLAACIRPTETSPTATPGDVNTALTVPTTQVIDNGQNSAGGTPPPQVIVSADQLAAQRFLESYGAQLSPATLTLWSIQRYQNDLVLGINFRNPSGLPCIGVGLANRDAANNLIIFTGGYHCATELGTPGVVAQWLLAASTGEALIIIAGWVTASDAFQAAVVFEGNPEPFIVQPQNGNFIYVRTDFVFASVVNIANAQGSLLGQLAVPISPQG
jgi:hypothetical protein